MRIVSDKRSRADDVRDTVKITTPFRHSRAATDRKRSTGTWGYTAGVKASREASQTHQTVNRRRSDHDQREEGGVRDRGGHRLPFLSQSAFTSHCNTCPYERDENAASKKETANLRQTQVRSRGGSTIDRAERGEPEKETTDIVICTLQHVIEDELAPPCEDGGIALSDNEETSPKILGLIC